MNRRSFGRTLVKSLKVALIVGTLLSLINQSEAIFSLTFTPGVSVRIFANYLIPTIVSTYLRMAAVNERGKFTNPAGESPAAT